MCARAASIVRQPHADEKNIFVCTLTGQANVLQVLPSLLCNDLPISAQSLLKLLFSVMLTAKLTPES